MQLGVIGLGTMGANLARNAARHGATVAVYNRTAEKVEEFVKSFGREGTFVPCNTLAKLTAALKPPRAILLMVKADAVDAVIRELAPFLEKNDILIDAGNSHYRDTERRQRELAGLQATSYKLQAKPIRFLGMGVSGGECGALEGPSMMPGGDASAWETLRSLFTKMAAEDGSTSLTTGGNGGKCIAYIGPGGAGHFVKMVHNGIEYGIMQLIAEAYHLLKSEGKFGNDKLGEIFERWNEGEDLRSFLIEITAKILRKQDPLFSSSEPRSGDAVSPRGANREAEGFEPSREALYLLDLIKDAAGGKGTGKWTTEAAMEYGVSIPTINAAVDARILSGNGEKRARWKNFPESIEQPYPKHEKLVARVRIALDLSIMCTYTQGFELIAKISTAQKWSIDCSEVARIWRGGCIIRSALLPHFQYALSGDQRKAKESKEELLRRFQGERQLEWRRAIALGIGRGIPLPAMSASLAYYDSYRTERLPQNLIQAQRDFFGAHGYERVDTPGTFHTTWG